VAAVAGAVKVPLKAPEPPVVVTVAAVVHGPLGDVLYWSTTGAPFGTDVVADTWPEKDTGVCVVKRGVVIVFSVVVVR
jgi:hypothetical protein